MAEKRKGRWASESDSDEDEKNKKTKEKKNISKRNGVTEESRRKENGSDGGLDSSETSHQNNLLTQSSLAQNGNEESERGSLSLNQSEMMQNQHRKLTYNPLFEGCRSVEVYQRLNFIDQGTYGLVFRAQCTETDEIVAIKQIKLSINENKAGFPITALREINILLSLKHPNIVNVKEMVVGSSIDKMYMVMEYIENDLKSCMQSTASPFSVAEVRSSFMSPLPELDEHLI
jgi:cell division cycle 2-like